MIRFGQLHQGATSFMTRLEGEPHKQLEGAAKQAIATYAEVQAQAAQLVKDGVSTFGLQKAQFLANIAQATGIGLHLNAQA